MGNIWHDISEDRIFPTDFISVIEISKGSVHWAMTVTRWTCWSCVRSRWSH